MCLLFPAGIKVAAPCPSKPFMGFEGQGNGRTHSYFIAVAEDLAGLRTPQGNVMAFLLEGREESPTSLTLRNSFGKLDDAVTCHIG